MKTATITIHNPTGLHARPARLFVDTAKKFRASIRVQHGSKEANAKSMISLLKLGVEQGADIQITAEGEDEAAALEALVALVTSGLGEDGASVASAPAAPVATAPAPRLAEPGARMIRGLPAAPGLAVGPIWQWRAAPALQPDPTFRSLGEEQAALTTALAEARRQIEQMAARVSRAGAADEAAIFAAHLEILHDPELLSMVEGRIGQGSSASVAWHDVMEQQAESLAALDDPLLAARAADIRDVSRLVLRLLLGVASEGPQLPDHAVILVADDLSPSDTATLDRQRILGFCTAKGTPTAHAAILARALGLPAVVGAGPAILELANGTPAILDGEQGLLHVEPAETTLQAARLAQEERQRSLQAARQAAHQPAVTLDGHRVEVAANIGAVAEAAQAREAGAEAIGLLRTEFLFLQRTQAPSVEEQAAVYGEVLDAMQGRVVIIRTLDVGGDKPLPYLTQPAESNPFLGVRGIRLCLQQPELLRRQLTAILQAAARGPLRVMFPMIATVEEWRQARALLDEVRVDIGGPAIEAGMMIEVPAAALMADIFAAEVDFFSIGTNDLTQYTLAVDRQHAELAALADGLHPAVLRLIAHTVEAAHRAGKWVGVCGELGADPQAIPILLGLGVDELSVNTPAVPTVKALIRRLEFRRCRQLAQQALACETADAVRTLSAALAASPDSEQTHEQVRPLS